MMMKYDETLNLTVQKFSQSRCLFTLIWLNPALNFGDQVVALLHLEPKY